MHILSSQLSLIRYALNSIRLQGMNPQSVAPSSSCYFLFDVLMLLILLEVIQQTRKNNYMYSTLLQYTDHLYRCTVLLLQYCITKCTVPLALLGFQTSESLNKFQFNSELEFKSMFSLPKKKLSSVLFFKDLFVVAQ